MTPKNSLKTELLILRPWNEGDIEQFANQNSDIRVMKYFPYRMRADERWTKK